MKKKILAVLLVLAVFASLAAAEVAVLRARPNADFGFVEEEYTLVRESWRYVLKDGCIPVDSCEDGGGLTVLGIGQTNWMPLAPALIFTTDRAIELTGVNYGGKHYDETKDLPFGTVERWENGEWVPAGDMGLNYVTPQPGDLPPFLSTDGPTETPRSIGTSLRLYEPARYRVTLNYRTKEGRYTTGDELYHTVFEFTVPEATEKPYDLIGWFMYLSEEVDDGASHGYYGGMMTLGIRSNDGTPLYCDNACNTVEMFEDGKWVPVPDTSDGKDAIEHLGNEDPELLEDMNRRYNTGDWNDTKNTYETEQISLRLPDTRHRYRVTLTFVENPDGTGKRHELTFAFRFEDEN